MTIADLGKSFAGGPVLAALSLEVADGELTAILGASGSGKTTLLRLMAGFLRADRGTIRLGERVVDGSHEYVPPERRRIGYVPQDGALFPHLDVAANVGFALRNGGSRRRRAESEARVRELLSLVGLEGFERRSTSQLSGGERQRVALARALAARPDLVLLDEPFSSLDVELRTSMRREVVDVLTKSGTTALLVTHDQDEALSIADRVAVLQHGTIVQYDEPAVLYSRPVNGEVARFVGHGNLLLGRLENGIVQSVVGELAVVLRSPAPERCAVGVLVRPEQIELSLNDDASSSERLAHGIVVSREFHGHDVLVGVRLEEPVWGQALGARPGFELLARLPGPLSPEPGTRVAIRVQGAAAAWVNPAEGESPPPPSLVQPGTGERVGRRGENRASADREGGE